MTTYSTIEKNTTSYGTTARSDATTSDGLSIGLLLTLTYSGQGTTYTTYGTITKNSTTYSTINKN